MRFSKPKKKDDHGKAISHQYTLLLFFHGRYANDCSRNRPI
jgi:hypothetical protein